MSFINLFIKNFFFSELGVWHVKKHSLSTFWLLNNWRDMVMSITLQRWAAISHVMKLEASISSFMLQVWYGWFFCGIEASVDTANETDMIWFKNSI